MGPTKNRNRNNREERRENRHDDRYERRDERDDIRSVDRRDNSQGYKIDKYKINLKKAMKRS